MNKMGCFDEVLAPCPDCGEISEFQTKSGACILAKYMLEDAPIDVLFDVNRHAPNTCLKCGTKFIVNFETTVKAWTEKYMES